MEESIAERQGEQAQAAEVGGFSSLRSADEMGPLRPCWFGNHQRGRRKGIREARWDEKPREGRQRIVKVRALPSRSEGGEGMTGERGGPQRVYPGLGGRGSGPGTLDASGPDAWLRGAVAGTAWSKSG